MREKPVLPAGSEAHSCWSLIFRRWRHKELSREAPHQTPCALPYLSQCGPETWWVSPACGLAPSGSC